MGTWGGGGCLWGGVFCLVGFCGCFLFGFSHLPTSITLYLESLLKSKMQPSWWFSYLLCFVRVILVCFNFSLNLPLWRILIYKWFSSCPLVLVWFWWAGLFVGFLVWFGFLVRFFFLCFGGYFFGGVFVVCFVCLVFFVARLVWFCGVFMLF